MTAPAQTCRCGHDVDDHLAAIAVVGECAHRCPCRLYKRAPRDIVHLTPGPHQGRAACCGVPLYQLRGEPVVADRRAVTCPQLDVTTGGTR